MTHPRPPLIITVNGGSSSIKISLATDAIDSTAVFSASLDRIGTVGAAFTSRSTPACASHTHALPETSFEDALAASVGALKLRIASSPVSGIGHRIVHGGMSLVEHQPITPSVILALKSSHCLDRAHGPGELELIEGFAAAFPRVPQVACFDTVFHRELPRIAQLLPIPRRYTRAGLRQFGFHGLSYTSLMRQFKAIAGPEAADGRIILAHLGAGASMAAVRGGKPIDTTMSFTPLSGLVMATRPGNLDPGVLIYLLATGALGDGRQTPRELADKLCEMLSTECGLLGVSEVSGDMRDLEACRATHAQANEAIDLFCYEARKHLCALAGALGGVDTIIFSGGIGEHSPGVRASICHDLSFLGIALDATLNEVGSGLISAPTSRVSVRVIPSDEESTMVNIVRHVVGSNRADGRPARPDANGAPDIQRLANSNRSAIDQSSSAHPVTPGIGEALPSPPHPQTVAEAKDEWRNEGNPN